MDVPEILNVFLTFMLGMPRILAIFAMVPLFTKSVLPGSVRNGVAIALLVFIYPTYSESIDLDALGNLRFLMLVFKELTIGICMGFILGAVFYAAEAMGFVIDNQRGSTMASSVDPMTGSQTSPLGILMIQMLTIYVFASGAIFVIILAIYESYVAIPVHTFLPPLNPAGADVFLGVIDRIMALALLLAAPAMIAMFMAEFALGLVSRFAPTLNVFFLSMPVKSAVGMFVLLLTLTAVFSIWGETIALLPTEIEALGRILQ